MKEKIKRIVNTILKSSKLFVFVGMMYTVWVMYKYGDPNVGFTILIITALFLLFNKMDNLQKQIKEMKEEMLTESREPPEDLEE